MKLKRTGFYRLTRILSWVLPVVIFAFIFMAAWSYLGRTRDSHVLARGDVATLPPGLEVTTEGARYRVSEGNRDVFLIHGRKWLGFKDNRTVLEDVEVLIYSQREQDPDRWIRGGECSHDKANNHIVCNRNVSVELEPGTIAHTEQLLYDHTNGIISSPVRTSLDRKGEMTGTSGRMEYLVNAGTIRRDDALQHFPRRTDRSGRLAPAVPLRLPVSEKKGRFCPVVPSVRAPLVTVL